MKILLDASALIAVLVNEPQKQRVVLIASGCELYSPSSTPLEIGNAFSAMLKRHRASLAELVAAYESYVKLPIRLLDVDVQRSLSLAAKLNIYAYDAYVIDCARRHALPLVSLDAGLVAAAIKTGVEVLEAD